MGFMPYSCIDWYTEMAGRLHIGNIDHRQACLDAGLVWHTNDHTPIRSPNHPPRRPTTVISLDAHNRAVLHESFWGLTPAWLKQLDRAPHCARAEGLLERPMFQEAIKTSRCIIPVTGIYVWQTSIRGKQPFMVTRVDRGPMLLAGIQTRYPMETHERLSFALITTSVAASLNTLTDRLPVIIGSEHLCTWLLDDTPLHDACALLRPAPSTLLGAFPVSRAINALDCQEWHCSYPTGPMFTASTSPTD